MKPNIIFIITDQQRWDTIAANGHNHVITPNLDKLCEGGVTFSTACAPGATCISSRAAVFTGMYPHNTGVYSFNRWAHQNTWVTDLADNGYHCVNVGKMHTDPIFAKNGFHERWVVENKCQDFVLKGLQEDDWGKFLLANGLKRPLNRTEMYDDWNSRLNCVEWEYEEKYHADFFTGDSAVRWIKNYDSDKPLFLEIGFPGPHEPYDPPKRFLDMYENVEIPDPVYRTDERKSNPPQHLGHQYHFEYTPNNAVINFNNATDSDIKKMRKHYYANITMIDEKIGQIMNALQDKGLLENSVVIFMSDHGDCLGDHKLPYKWLMYDPMIRVPLIIKDFRKPETSRTIRIDDPVSLMDIGPTIMDYTQTPTPAYIEGKSLRDCLETGSLTRKSKYVFCEDNYLIMARSQKYKMVYYIDQEYGELYDLENDPNELNNLWENPEYTQLKLEIKSDILAWIAKSSYFNSGYKQTRSRSYAIRWPNQNGFGYNLQGIPISKEVINDCKTLSCVNPKSEI